MITSQSNELAFQLITNVAATMSAGSSILGTDEVWYLFGYPDDPKRLADNVVNKVVAATGGSYNIVTVFAAQRGIGKLVGQQGVWVLARVPTVIQGTGPAFDANLINDGYNRFIYDITSNVKIYSAFNNTQQIQIFLNGVKIFDGNPLPGVLTPLNPIQDNTNAYTPTGLHFDGATGLVTATPLVTQNTGIVSFAGWFNIDPSLSGQLEFSNGNGSNTLFYDRSIPTPGAWCHMMGTVEGGSGKAAIFVNGNLGIGESSLLGNFFSSAPTNGKNLYIGTDNQGKFYKGDIADLAIWFDFSLFQGNTIPPATTGKLAVYNQNLGGITTIAPMNPSLWIFGFNTQKQAFQVGVNNINAIEQPSVFLSGPASQALAPQTQVGTLVQTILSMKVVSGALSNSATNPGTITIGPPI